MMTFLNNATMCRIVLSAAKQGRKMKILKNEDEYRRWIIEDHFHMDMDRMEDAEMSLIYEPDIQRTLNILHPREFPCLAYTESTNRMSNNHEIRYIYQDEFENIIASLA
ncbi:hypothetical protein [Rahnella victoriana]|uniref:hypothetical protein n=1 Tax=Rahnella victoriana TaxID=1510570 RepID=UPI001E61B846|nr:hypothetical protein [Rahnella victoriana]UHM93629.1 hypothetical protein J9880_25050 [Rahnella victoriana]